MSEQLEFEVEEDDSNDEPEKGFWYTVGDSNRALQAFSARMVDIYREQLESDVPSIRGLAKTPLVTLEEAVQGLLKEVPSLEGCLDQCSRYVNLIHNYPDGIDKEDFKVLLMCTWPWEELDDDHSVYHLVNSKLRNPNRQTLQPYLVLMKVFLTALYKLPVFTGTVWTGVREDVTHKYKEGQRIIWWGFSSFSENIRTVKRPDFVGRYGTKTLFSVCTNRAFRLNFSHEASEVIVPPGIQLRVENVFNSGEGVKIVELVEVVPEIGLIDFPEVVYELGSEECYMKRLEDYSKGGDMDMFVRALKNLPRDKEMYLYTFVFQMLLEHIIAGECHISIHDMPGLLQLVLSVMGIYQDSSDFQSLGCSLIHSLKLAENVDEVLRKEAMSAVVKAMGSHLAHTELLNTANSLLQSYMTSDKRRAFAAQQGLVSACFKVLEANSQNETVVEDVYRTLSVLSLNIETTKLPKCGGGIKQIVTSIDDFCENSSVVEHGLVLLARLSKRPVNTRLVVKEGGVNTILNGLKEHTDHAGVQLNGCLALARLSESAKNAETIAAQGGIAAIVSAMSSNVSDKGIQRNGCLALANLAENKTNAFTISRENAYETILRAMSEHEDSENVQEAGCLALANLNSHSENDGYHLVEILHKTMIRHFDHRGVQAQACRCLAAIWRDAPEKEVSAIDVQVIESVIRTVTCHHGHGKSVEYGFLALVAVAESTQVQNILQNGGVTVAIEALNSHADRPCITQSVLKLLNIVSERETIQTDIAKNGGIRSIVNALVHAPFHAETQLYGTHILSRLAKNKDKYKGISNSVVIEAVKSTKENHPQDNAIQQNVKCFLNRTLGKNSGLRKKKQKP